MSKARPLRRIIQDQHKLHANRQHGACLHAYAVRIPFGSNRPFRVELPPLPPGYRFMSADDLGFEPVIHPFGDPLPLLARGRSLYQGQIAGLIMGHDIDTLRSLMSFINCMPADGEAGSATLASQGRGRQLYKSRTLAFDNPRAAINDSVERIESQLHLDPMVAPDLEDRHIWAGPQGEGIAMEAAHPWPHLLRKIASEATGLPQKLITVSSGSTSQLKPQRLTQGLIPAGLAALVAMTLGEGVVMHWSALDNLRFGFHQAEADFRILTAHDSEGTLKALRVQADLDMGACVVGSDEIISQIIMSFLAVYQAVPSEIKVNLYAGTDCPRTTGMGFGDNMAQQAMEQHLDLVAARFDQSPAALRLEYLRNQPRGPGELEFDDSVHLAQMVLAKTVQASDFARRHSSFKLQNTRVDPIRDRRHGIGLAIGYQPGNLMDSEVQFRPQVSLRLEEDGQLYVSAPIEPGNNSVKASWAHIIETATGINERNISFETLGTIMNADPGPLVLGRQYSVISPLLGRALRSFLDADEAGKPRTVTVERSQQEVPGWGGSRLEGRPFCRRTWGAASVELFILPESRTIQVRRVWMCVHAGAQFQETRAKSILESGIRESIRFCLGHLSYADPFMLGFHWSRLRSVQDNIEINVIILPSQNNNPEGLDVLDHASGIETMPTLLVPPAFMNALSQSLGRHITSFPPTQHELLREDQHVH